MPNETDGLQFSDEQVHRAMSNLHDPEYLKELADAEAEQHVQDEIKSTDRLLEMIAQSRQERGPQKPVTDTRAIMEANISKTKRIPIELLEDEWEKKEQAAEQDTEQGHTNLEAARLAQFGGKKPILYEGRVIGFEEPPGPQEDVKEVRKGTHSRHIHKPKNSRSTVVMRPKGSNQRDMRDADQRVKTDKELRGDI